MEQTEFRVAGMTCQGCVRSVRNVLETLPGVSAVDVSLEDGRVNIEYDPNQTGTKQFKEVVEGAGYGVMLS